MSTATDTAPDTLHGTLQRYPASPCLAPLVIDYFSADHADELRLLAPEPSAKHGATLLLDLGAPPEAWLCRGTAPRGPLVMRGPVFGARLRNGIAQRLVRLQEGTPLLTWQRLEHVMACAEAHGGLGVQALLERLCDAPYTAHRIVALDRYLAERLL